MNPPRRRPRPNYQISLDLDDLARAHERAEAALDMGDYYIASRIATREGDREILGCALLMCGSIDRGLALLAGVTARRAATALYHAFGFWCAGRPGEALEMLSSLGDGDLAARAERLVAYIEGAETRILILHGPHAAPSARRDLADGFRIETVCVEPAENPGPLAAMGLRGGKPDAVVVLDIYGSRLPGDLFQADLPVIFWSYDSFYHLARQLPDLTRAHAVIVNSAFEHAMLRPLCDGRLAAFVGHDVYKEHGGFTGTKTAKDIDILHTGIAFSPLMRDKAQFLFRLATLDDPGLEIQIHNRFLGENEYRDAISRARMVPNFSNRFHGGFPSRSLDAMRAGAMVIHPRDIFADNLLDGARGWVVEVEQDSLEGDLSDHLSGHLSDAVDFSAVKADMERTFWASPARETRFIKYCLFQVILGEHRRPPDAPAAKGSAAASVRALGGFERLIHTPLDESLRARVSEIFASAVASFPDALVLQFNHGRLLWLLGDRDGAGAAFRQVVRLAPDGRFDPMGEDIRLQLHTPAQEMTPYQDYYAALARDIMDGQAAQAPGARKVIAATAHCYLGLDEVQNDGMEAGIAHLRECLALCRTHFPAARLLAKALHAAACPADAVGDAFEQAIDLYPPYLTELLPIGIQAAEAVGGPEAALDLVRDWAYFITRVHWGKPAEHPIAEQTWRSAAAYFESLPAALARRIRARYDQWLAETGKGGEKI